MFDVTSIVGRHSTVTYTGAGTIYPVKTASAYYVFYVGNSSLDPSYKKSTDGVTWGSETALVAGSATAMSVWYDGWSGLSDGLIHIAYTDSGSDDTIYLALDTSNDSLSATSVIHAGTTTAAGGALSICRSRGGHLFCKTSIDGNAEGGFYKSTATGASASWSSLTDSETLETGDQWILLPGWAADNQDMMLFFYDHSALEVSVKFFDDSGNTWATTAEIAIKTIGGAGWAASTNYPHFAATVDTTNSQNLLVTWSDPPDTASADLQCWMVDEGGVTETTTPVVSNGTDDQGLCAIAIDTATQDWYVFYSGKSDGSEAWNVAGTYYKKSTDDGATWGSETQVLPDLTLTTAAWMSCAMRFDTHPLFTCVHNGGAIMILATVDTPTSSGGARVIGG